MNNTEARYSVLLDARRAAGEIAGWWFESLTLKLAPDTRYTPDFLVMLADGSLECHEIKAMWSNGSVARDDAAVKYKVAAQLFPFRFLLCVSLPKKQGGGWQITEV